MKGVRLLQMDSNYVRVQSAVANTSQNNSEMSGWLIISRTN